jgi:hypothetical protein
MERRSRNPRSPIVSISTMIRQDTDDMSDPAAVAQGPGNRLATEVHRRPARVVDRERSHSAEDDVAAIDEQAARRDDVAATGCCRDIILPEHRDRPRRPAAAGRDRKSPRKCGQSCAPGDGAVPDGVRRRRACVTSSAAAAWRRSMAGPIVIGRRYGSHRRHPALAGRARPAPE